MQVWEFCEEFMNSQKLEGASVHPARSYAIALGRQKAKWGQLSRGRGRAGPRGEQDSPQPSLGHAGGGPGMSQRARAERGALPSQRSRG